jgi:hypothetical protein
MTPNKTLNCVKLNYKMNGRGGGWTETIHNIMNYYFPSLTKEKLHEVHCYY